MADYLYIKPLIRNLTVNKPHQFMTIEALSGEITKTGKSGRIYVFNFGWALQYALEEKYGPNLREIGKNPENHSNLGILAETLVSSLRIKEINNIPGEVSRRDAFLMMDDFSEADVKELWKAATQALGFMERIVLDEEAINVLKEAALRNQAKPAKSATNES